MEGGGKTRKPANSVLTEQIETGYNSAKYIDFCFVL